MRLTLSNRISFLLALLLLLLAAFLRLHHLNALPAGLQDREIRTVRLTETVRQGTITILFEDGDGEGTEMLVPTALAVTTIFTGNGPLAFRWTMALMSLLTLALVYTLAVRLFGRLAGLASLSLLTVTFWPILLGRSILIDAFLPLLIVMVMLSLARAIPVYRAVRQESATTSAFATLGAAVGIGFYVHPVGLLVALAAMVFIVYVLMVRRPFDRQRMGFIGFSLLIVLILTIPYLVFNVNRPDLGASERLFTSDHGLLQSIFIGLQALFTQGDADPAHNLALRPLFDPFSVLLMVVGLIAALRSLRYARYTLVLVFLAVLAPAALLVNNSPNFLGLTVWLVPLGLLFGAGVHIVCTRLPRLAGGGVLAALMLLLVVNIGWTSRDLWTVWPNEPAVEQAFHTDLYQLAHHLDRTLNAIPTVICYPRLNTTAAVSVLSSTQRMLLMMNRDDLDNARFVDCNRALLFVQGGDREQIVLAEPDALTTMHPYIREWMSLGSFQNDETLPPDRVLRLAVSDTLANRIGAFTTLDGAKYGFETALTPQDTIYPPVRFGGNITWLGYEPDTASPYRAGDTVDVINYWRVENGSIPADLQFFTHILSDPVTIASNRDIISVDVDDLRVRDVFVQVTPIVLQSTLLPGRYEVSVGAYQRQTLARLPVFDADQVRQGDRLILYPIEIVN